MSKPSDAGQAIAERLAEQIRRDGPITFYDWMLAALYDAHDGYYLRSDLERWGREGDYRTSPETSALFAATFARYFAELFEKLGSPDHFTIVEAGAGAGHFAVGLLETLERRYPRTFERTTYIIDEVSQHSRLLISDRVANFRRQVQFKRLSDLNSIDPGIVFANELLDAFPVHRVTLHNGNLVELYVGLNEDRTFAWREGPVSTVQLLAYLDRFQISLREGQIVEINPDVEAWFSQVSKKLNQGYVINVDYGADAAELYGDPSRNQGTLRAFKQHRFAAAVLDAPGEQDITTTVDWTAVLGIGNDLGYELVRFERLDRFLLEQGLLEELELRINEVQDPGEKVKLRTSAREMILPSGMAESFQVLVQRRNH